MAPAVLGDREILLEQGQMMAPHVLAMGNALLDVIVRVEDENVFNDEFVDHFHLMPHVGQEKEAEVLAQIVQTAKNRLGSEAISMNAGGCAQNTCRILSWVEKGLSVCMAGSVGDDEEGNLLKTKVEQDGVICKFVRRSSDCTGRTVALVIGDERTFITNLGAASHFELADLKQLHIRLAEDTLVYVESYFAVHSFDVALNAALECARKPHSSFAFNLCGEYVLQEANFVRDICTRLLPNVDILFGNQNELKAFAERIEQPGLGKAILDAFEADVEAKDPDDFEDNENNDENESTDKIVQVVVTSGPDPITVFKLHNVSTQPQTKHVRRVRVPPVPELVDSIGAGDAFVAGFLSAKHVHKWSLQKCIKQAIHVAQAILRQPGTRLPNEPFRPLN